MGASCPPSITNLHFLFAKQKYPPEICSLSEPLHCPLPPLPVCPCPLRFPWLCTVPTCVPLPLLLKALIQMAQGYLATSQPKCYIEPLRTPATVPCRPGLAPIAVGAGADASGASILGHKRAPTFSRVSHNPSNCSLPPHRCLAGADAAGASIPSHKSAQPCAGVCQPHAWAQHRPHTPSR
jgi:hypothetical protein